MEYEILPPTEPKVMLTLTASELVMIRKAVGNATARQLGQPGEGPDLYKLFQDLVAAAEAVTESKK